MADFNYGPSAEAPAINAPRVLLARFGDGYEQRAADGINNQLRRWENLSFVHPRATARAIRDFLATKGGVTSFTWPEPDNRTVNVRVVCRSWSYRTFGGVGIVTATFEEVPA